jgi:hypothetical protein
MYDGINGDREDALRAWQVKFDAFFFGGLTLVQFVDDGCRVNGWGLVFSSI